jgi:hypothetical protein
MVLGERLTAKNTGMKCGFIAGILSARAKLAGPHDEYERSAEYLSKPDKDSCALRITKGALPSVIPPPNIMRPACVSCAQHASR